MDSTHLASFPSTSLSLPYLFRHRIDDFLASFALLLIRLELFPQLPDALDVLFYVLCRTLELYVGIVGEQGSAFKLQHVHNMYSPPDVVSLPSKRATLVDVATRGRYLYRKCLA